LPLDEEFKKHYSLTESDEKQIEARNELVTQGRNLRRVGNIASNKKVKFIFKPAGNFAANEIETLKLLLNADALEVNVNYQPAKGTPAARTELGELYLPDEAALQNLLESRRVLIVAPSGTIEKIRRPDNDKSPLHLIARAGQWELFSSR